MAKPGKPNTFFKGMKADAEEALQPKESYRYAKNARVTSHDGDNVSIQPFPSDRLALDFVAEVSTANNAPAMAYTEPWVDLTEVEEADTDFQSTFETGTIGFILELQGFPVAEFIEDNDGNLVPNPQYSVFQPWLDIQVQGNFTDYNPASEENPLILTVVLTVDNGSTITIPDINISVPYALADSLGIVIYVDT